jgi:hypothetical protein
MPTVLRWDHIADFSIRMSAASHRTFMSDPGISKPSSGCTTSRSRSMRDFLPMKSALLSAICDRNRMSSKVNGMSTLEIDVGDIRPVSVAFSADELVVTLADGRRIATPLIWYPRLRDANAAARGHFELMPMGIHWPELDEDLGIAGMLRGRPGA